MVKPNHSYFLNIRWFQSQTLAMQSNILSNRDRNFLSLYDVHLWHYSGFKWWNFIPSQPWSIQQNQSVFVLVKKLQWEMFYFYFFMRSRRVIDWFILVQEVFLTQRFSAPFISPRTLWHPSVSPSVSGIHLYVLKFNKRLKLKQSLDSSSESLTVMLFEISTHFSPGSVLATPGSTVTHFFKSNKWETGWSGFTSRLT